MLKIDKLNKKYANTPVLTEFAMNCQNTGVTAIMGASGIGKTTLLNIIAGIQKADSGEIISDFKKISYKFQEPRLLNWLTAKENVEAVSSPTEAHKWLKAVGLEDNADKYPDELSGGMQQRVALARALAFGGDLLLLDEPFSAVDADTKKMLIDVIADYAKSNAIILVTHDSSDADLLNAEIIAIK